VARFTKYYETNNPPTSKIGDGQTEHTLNFTTISGTDYFWYIVVKDNNGSEVTGQIWDFKTE